VNNKQYFSTMLKTENCNLIIFLIVSIDYKVISTLSRHLNHRFLYETELLSIRMAWSYFLSYRNQFFISIK